MTTHARHIMIVEDDQSVAISLERLLQANGLVTRSFPSAEEFIESGDASDAACLVIDVGLPGISGFDLVQTLTDAELRTPILLITANDRPGNVERAQAAGASGYFVKPFVGREFVQAVLAACSGSPEGFPPHRSSSSFTN